MKNYMLVLVAILMMCASCVDGLNPRRNVLIRLNNVSEFDFKDILVDANGSRNEYGNLGAGNFSIYKDFDTAYQQIYIEFRIDNQAFSFQSVDTILVDSMLVEEELENGKYTFEVDIDTTTDEIMLNFIEE